MNKRDAKRLVAKSSLTFLQKARDIILRDAAADSTSPAMRRTEADPERVQKEYDALIKLLEDRTKAVHSSSIRW